MRRRGNRTINPYEEETQGSFGFMNNGVSSEENELIIGDLAEK